MNYAIETHHSKGSGLEAGAKSIDFKLPVFIHSLAKYEALNYYYGGMVVLNNSRNKRQVEGTVDTDLIFTAMADMEDLVQLSSNKQA